MLRMQMNSFSHWQRFQAQGLRVFVLFMLGAVMAGCQQANNAMQQSTPQLAVKDKFPIRVAPRQESMALTPVMAGKKIVHGDAQKITSFAGGFLRDGHGPLAIILPGIPNNPQMTAQMQAVNAVLADRGVPNSSIEWRIASPDAAAPAASGGASGAAVNAPAGQLVFTYTRFTASLEQDCGNWEKNITSHDNQPWANFGCASQHNLAAMVSDPLDLVQPRDTTPIDVDRRTVVIKAYREGTKTTSERTAAEKGTVSEVAK